MTFKIVDGREHFYQWDLNRQIIVDDPAIKEVHFCNRMDNCSLVVEVENGIANVPNILLQKSFSIRVFAYDGHATLFDKIFEVKARTRPSDYVYTETEVKRLEDVEEKLFKEIDERLKEIEGGLITDGFATKEYVDEAVSNVSVDLSGYAKESYVDEAVNKAKPDLSGYAKKTEIPDVSKFITNIPSEYITESELNSKGYLTQHQDISGKADVNHTHSEYAKTKHTHSMADVDGLQLAISERATQEDIDKAIELHNHNDLYAAKEHNHDDKYATRGHVHSYNDLTNKPEIPSIEGLASEAYVNAAIANIEIPEGGDVDLSDYYTKEEVDTQIASTTKFETINVGRNKDEGYYFIKEEDALKIYNNPLRYKLRFLSDEYMYDRRYNVSTANCYLFVAHSFEIDSNYSPVHGSKNLAVKAIEFSSNNIIDGKCVITEVTNIDLASKDYVDEAIQNALNAIGVAEGGAY
jgi:hypothetical protein